MTQKTPVETFAETTRHQIQWEQDSAQRSLDELVRHITRLGENLTEKRALYAENGNPYGVEFMADEAFNRLESLLRDSARLRETTAKIRAARAVMSTFDDTVLNAEEVQA